LNSHGLGKAGRNPRNRLDIHLGEGKRKNRGSEKGQSQRLVWGREASKELQGTGCVDGVRLVEKQTSLYFMSK
jgi:hypothetical protein